MALERHVTTRQVRQKVNAYLRGDMSLSAFRFWFASTNNRLPILYNIKVALNDLIVSFMMNGKYDEFMLKATLRKL